MANVMICNSVVLQVCNDNLVDNYRYVSLMIVWRLLFGLTSWLVMQRTQPNLKEDTAIYPVIVYIHSGDFSSGTSQIQPGHVLTLQNVVVVTFNYRLGSLGR